MNISVNTSAKPRFRDLTTVNYIHAFLFLTSDLSDLAEILARTLFPGHLRVWWGGVVMGWGVESDGVVERVDSKLRCKLQLSH